MGGGTRMFDAVLTGCVYGVPAQIRIHWCCREPFEAAVLAFVAEYNTR